ncbi:MAG TPA: hypothetical protein VGM78_06595, partial [Ilumatobacteraceae bacterium]
PMAQAMRLTALGWWLRVNGAAIYGTRPWRTQTAAAGDGRAVRYTTDGEVVYAILQGAPDTELRLGGIAVREGSTVQVLGNDRCLPHRVRDDELTITLADHQPPAPATVFAIRGAR